MIALLDQHVKKVCRGKSHSEPTELPVTEEFWYFHKKGDRAGKPLSICITCSLLRLAQARGRDSNTIPSGRYVPSDKVQSYASELVNRMGILEAERYSGIARDTLRRMMRGEGKFQRKTVRKLLASLWRARREGVMRHKKSIKYGTTVRRELQTVRGHVRSAAGPFKKYADEVTIPEFSRRVTVNERKAMRPSEQYGPVYPEVEAAMRNEEAKARRDSRSAAKDEPKSESSRRADALRKLKKRYGAEEAEWEIVYYDLRLDNKHRRRLRMLDPSARSEEIAKLRLGDE